ncbi:MAG: hypothetical protein PHS32_15685 [Rhodoferax sp.]|uniref:hypothetical protein n=1 Tax=Rhodoferax sp. TaxID=50421 RepID=UPI002601AB86|nr:hypothetical protein [Rhodoferax sp.]MDD5335172.1 hypothetical protein [Rhodoferax sp.]
MKPAPLLILLLGLLLGAAGIWYRPAAAPDGSSPAAGPTAPHAAAPLTAERSSDVGNGPASVPPWTPAQAPTPAPTSSAGGGSAWVAPALTRQQEPAPKVSMAGRDWLLLGAREVVNGNAKQTIVVLRDELSGQLEYRQSALRVVLREGLDYEAFIRERPHARRLFVNPLYGEIAVDPAQIGAEYLALSSDPRVLKVTFLPIAVPLKAR